MLAQLAACLLAALSQQVAPPRFRIVPLETLGVNYVTPISINARGEMVGYVTDTFHDSTAAFWAGDGSLTPLARFGSRCPSIGFSINDSGVIVGAAYVPRPLALLWTRTDGGRPGPWDQWSMAADINNSNDVLLLGPQASTWSLLERDGTRHAIDIPFGVGGVYALDDDGQVVGHRWDGATLGPFRWTEEGGMEDLAVPADCNNGVAYASCSGTVAGRWITSSGMGRAVLWDPAGLSRVLPSSGPDLHAMARGINADGWVVGDQSSASLEARHFGTLWFEGNVYKLEQLVANGSQVQITNATAINAAGQIVCHGVLDGRWRAMRLDPL